MLDFVFGNTGFTEGSICHHPSNQDLLSWGVRSVSSRMRSLSYGNLAAAGSWGRSDSAGCLEAVAEARSATQAALLAAADEAACVAAGAAEEEPPLARQQRRSASWSELSLSGMAASLDGQPEADTR